MTEIKTQGQSDFFGKDGLTPFIGQVEDINDPKHAGRVKVRCVGWHPYEKDGDDGLKTDDLPWARVGSPTTHAQTGRVGGKHGLLVGSWVFGFFLDGDDAQDAFVVNTFPFTAGASDKDYRKIDEDGKEKGTTSEQQGFTKILANPNHPNEHLQTTKEKQEKGFSEGTDKSGDSPSLDDSTDAQCGPRESRASENRMKQEYKKGNGQDGNHTAQCYDASLGDGGAGSNAHAQQDIQKIMKEKMPGVLNRFSYGDITWEEFSGSFIDLQGIMSQVALQISGIMKGIQLQTKAIVEDKTNRITKSVTLFGSNQRDPVLSFIADESMTLVHDMFHAAFEQVLSQIPSQVMGMISEIDSSGSVQDYGSPDLSNMIVNNIEKLTDAGLEQAGSESEEDDEDNEGGSSGSSKLSLPGGLGNILDFSMLNKFSVIGSKVHNLAGNASSDPRTRQGSAKMERFYRTCKGEQSGQDNVSSALGGAGSLVQSAVEKASQAAQESLNNQKEEADKIQSDAEKDGDDSNKVLALDSEWLRGALTDTRSSDNPRYAFSGAMDVLADTYVPLDVSTLFYPGAVEDLPVFNPPTFNDLTGNSTGYDYQGREEDFIIDMFANLGFGGKRKDFNGPYTTEIPEDAKIRKLRPGDEIPEGVPYEFVPSGFNAAAFALSLPSSVLEGAKNYNEGIPNTIVVKNGGKNYFYVNEKKPEYCFPKIRIRQYSGIPVPVIDPRSGELVAVLTEYGAWSPSAPDTSIAVFPDKSPVGIRTDDPDFDLEVGGFHISNTGFKYTTPTIDFIDRDTDKVVGSGKAVVVQGRIVDVEIINSGTGFRRLPKIRINEPGNDGFGATLLPIMSVIERPGAKKAPNAVQMIYCPAKNQQNLI